MTQQYYDNTEPVRAPAENGERPVSEIVKQLWENAEKLARQELALAVAELDQKVDTVKKDVVSATIGGSVL